MNTVHEEKKQIEEEVQAMIKRLIHPQTKDYFDEEQEKKIIDKSE